MNFNTQICTTIEQSERLLALGLKDETADMFHLRVVGDSEDEFDKNNFAECTESIYDRYSYPKEDVIPAWSLHRLIAMYCSGLISCQYDLVGVSFEGMIGYIEAAIKMDKFNKEYLEDTE